MIPHIRRGDTCLTDLNSPLKIVVDITSLQAKIDKILTKAKQ